MNCNLRILEYYNIHRWHHRSSGGPRYCSGLIWTMSCGVGQSSSCYRWSSKVAGLCWFIRDTVCLSRQQLLGKSITFHGTWRGASKLHRNARPQYNWYFRNFLIPWFCICLSFYNLFFGAIFLSYSEQHCSLYYKTSKIWSYPSFVIS